MAKKTPTADLGMATDEKLDAIKHDIQCLLLGATDYLKDAIDNGSIQDVKVNSARVIAFKQILALLDKCYLLGDGHGV